MVMQYAVRLQLTFQFTATINACQQKNTVLNCPCSCPIVHAHWHMFVHSGRSVIHKTAFISWMHLKCIQGNDDDLVCRQAVQEIKNLCLCILRSDNLLR